MAIQPRGITRRRIGPIRRCACTTWASCQFPSLRSSSVPFKEEECATRNMIDFHSCPFSITTRRGTNVRFHSCPFFSFITLTFFHYKKGGRGRILKYMLAKKNYIHLIIIIINIKKIKI